MSVKDVVFHTELSRRTDVLNKLVTYLVGISLYR